MENFKSGMSRILDKFKMREYKEEQTIHDMEAYKEKVLRTRKVTYLRLAVIAGAIILGAFLVKYFIDHHKYDRYVVEETSEKSDTGTMQYVELSGKLLRYSGDGAALSSAAGTTVWNDSFQMSSPHIDMFGTTIVIYDQEGTQISIYNEKEKLGSFQTQYPILKASVCKNGSVAVLLDDSENTWMNYYAPSGSLIASSSTNMRNPGYPMDLAVSEDGLNVAVAYFVPDGDTVSSYLAFYNFGEEGKNKEDNLVNGFRYEGILIPKVEYLDSQTMVAYREDGFTIYRGKSTPEEAKNVIFDDNIISSFSDGSRIGFVFSDSASGHPFRMEVYGKNGTLQMETGFDQIYDNIKISSDQIIVNNSSEVSIFNMKGIEKFSGNIEEGNVVEVVKTGLNRYLVAYSGGTITIRLK
ncbi:MAG: DUF5711 family protein [Lachnospiraceae bacterium]|nr:DUF5711 family protein [Lachnospiraceae bacterium]